MSPKKEPTVFSILYINLLASNIMKAMSNYRYNYCLPQLINAATLPCNMKCSIAYCATVSK